MNKYDVLIVGTGPAGLGAAFGLLEKKPDLSILVIDKTLKERRQVADRCFLIERGRTVWTGTPAALTPEQLQGIAGKLLAPEVMVTLETDPAKARATARLACSG